MTSSSPHPPSKNLPVFHHKETVRWLSLPAVTQVWGLHQLWMVTCKSAGSVKVAWSVACVWPRWSPRSGSPRQRRRQRRPLRWCRWCLLLELEPCLGPSDGEGLEGRGRGDGNIRKYAYMMFGDRDEPMFEASPPWKLRWSMPLFSFDIKEVMQKNIVNSLNIITTKMVCSPLSMSWYTFETYRGVCKKASTCECCSYDYMLINRKCAPRIDTFWPFFPSRRWNWGVPRRIARLNHGGVSFGARRPPPGVGW